MSSSVIKLVSSVGFASSNWSTWLVGSVVFSGFVRFSVALAFSGRLRARASEKIEYPSLFVFFFIKSSIY